MGRCAHAFIICFLLRPQRRAHCAGVLAAAQCFGAIEFTRNGAGRFWLRPAVLRGSQVWGRYLSNASLLRSRCGTQRNNASMVSRRHHNPSMVSRALQPVPPRQNVARCGAPSWLQIARRAVAVVRVPYLRKGRRSCGSAPTRLLIGWQFHCGWSQNSGGDLVRPGER